MISLSAESTSVTFCAAHADPVYGDDDPLTGTLRLLDLAEQMYKDIQVKREKSGQSPSSDSVFDGTTSKAEHSSCKEVNLT